MKGSQVSTDDLARIVRALAESLRSAPGQFVSMHIESVTGFVAGGPGGGSYTNYGTMEASPSFTASASSPGNNQDLVAAELDAFAAVLVSQPDDNAVRKGWAKLPQAPPVLTTAIGELLALGVFHAVVRS